MKTINPNCSNEDSFKYSLLISLYYYHLKEYKERTNKLNRYISDHNFTSIEFKDFEKNNPNISLSAYDDHGRKIYESNNKSNNKANIVKINNRYHALKPTKNKCKQLEDKLKHFNHKELSEFIFSKIIQYF